MNFVIPFTKDVKFKTNIGEILSVSLEHDYTANSDEILGNFTISGEYKTHEVSVNKEHFEYVLPFSVDISSKIDTESVEFEVEDFTYEVVDNDTLRVNIEYRIKASEVKEEPLFKEVKEEELDDILSELEDVREDAKEERDISEEAKETILENVSLKEEEVYVTYHIHEMKEADTVESICTKYNVTDASLGAYNDLSTISLGDKIIVPEVNE